MEKPQMRRSALSSFGLKDTAGLWMISSSPSREAGRTGPDAEVSLLLERCCGFVDLDSSLASTRRPWTARSLHLKYE